MNNVAAFNRFFKNFQIRLCKLDSVFLDIIVKAVKITLRHRIIAFTVAIVRRYQPYLMSAFFQRFYQSLRGNGSTVVLITVNVRNNCYYHLNSRNAEASPINKNTQSPASGNDASNIIYNILFYILFVNF